MNRFFEDSHSDLLFKSWHHRHEFVAEERGGISGTIARDIITYELTFGPLSSVVNSLFIRRRCSELLNIGSKLSPGY